eukprot:3056545-Prymnesium_polylepis.1
MLTLEPRRSHVKYATYGCVRCPFLHVLVTGGEVWRGVESAPVARRVASPLCVLLLSPLSVPLLSCPVPRLEHDADGIHSYARRCVALVCTCACLATRWCVARVQLNKRSLCRLRRGTAVRLISNRRVDEVPTQGGVMCTDPPWGWFESNEGGFQKLGRLSRPSNHHLPTWCLRDLRGFDRE